MPANSAATPFPLNNLPYGVFSVGEGEPRCGVAIGDMILDVTAAEKAGLISLTDEPLFEVPYWNDLMEEGPAVWAALRARLTALLFAEYALTGAVAGFIGAGGAMLLAWGWLDVVAEIDVDLPWMVVPLAALGIALLAATCGVLANLRALRVSPVAVLR